MAGAALLAAERLRILPVPAGEFRPVPRVPAEGWTLTAQRATPSASGHPRASAPPETAPPRPAPTSPLVTVPRPVAKPSAALVVHVPDQGKLTGNASWYCRAGQSTCMRGYPDRAGLVDAYAAAGPKLRAAICGIQSCTSWRNRVVTVDGVRVRLVDWCQCFWRQSNEKLIDLYYDVFATTGSRVTIRW